MPEYLTLDKCHCGQSKLVLTQIAELQFEVKCPKCGDFAWGNTADFAVKKWNEMQGNTENPNESASPAAKKVKDCCKLTSNLVPDLESERKDISIRVCKVCGCRHIRMKSDPGRFIGRIGG